MLQFSLYKSQTDARIKNLHQGLEAQKETIEILLSTYEQHMLN